VVRADGALLVADACNHAIRRGAVAPPDAPTVDLPVERPGVIRHMDVTNLTTSAWTWRIIRYPSASTALLSSTTVRNPTFTPDQVDLYRIRLEGTDDSGRRTIRTIEIEGAELNEPRFDTVGVSAGNVILTGSGGTPGSPFTLLWSTNASLPSQEWSIVSGNRFDNQGSFALTNEMSLPENYYRIRVP
jgi:hypothetical protein